MLQEQRTRLFADKELDFACAFGSQARFRVNAVWQRKVLSIACRVFHFEVPSILSR